MDISEEYIDFLRFLKRQDHHRVDLSATTDNHLQMLKLLKDIELVEFEPDESRYYLAYEGFIILEKIDKKETPPRDNGFDIIKSLGGISQFNKILLIGLTVLVIFRTGYYFYEKVSQTAPKAILPKELINSVEEELKYKLDSIEQTKINSK